MTAGPQPPRRIAACVDDDEASDLALGEGARIRALTGGRLVALHAAPGADPAPPEWLRRRARGAPGAEPLTIPDRGHPAAAVCDWAEREGADLLVVAPHEGRAARLLLGSFASHLVHHAPSPVLVARPSPAPPPSDEPSRLDALVEPVAALPADLPAGEALARVRAAGCALPVVGGDGRLAGILGERDLLGAMVPAYLAGLPHPGILARDLPALRDAARRALARPVSEHMRPPVALRPGDALVHAADLMLREGLDALPVADAEGRPAGIVRAVALVDDLRTGVDGEGASDGPAPAPEGPHRHIACCVGDDDAAAARTVALGAALRALGAGRMSVVHAVPTPAAPAGAARGRVAALAEGAAAEPVLLTGEPAVAIAAWARSAGVDLLAVAPRRGPVEGAVLGSVSRRLAHGAPCSVLLVR